MGALGLLFLTAFAVGARSFDRDAAFNSPFILQSNSLPEDLNFMPTLGNGHIGFTVYSDSIFVNGIYNGRGGLSHRARIPNVGNISVIPTGSEPYTRDSFKLDLIRGIFERKQSNAHVETIIRTYPHRYFNKAIINEIFVQRKSNATATALTFDLKVHAGSPTEDFNIVTATSDSTDDHMVGCLATRDVEDEELQRAKSKICMAMNFLPKKIELRPNRSSFYLRYVIAIADSAQTASKEYKDVQATTQRALFKTHTAQWKHFWNQFLIELDGNLELSRTINAGIFYLASSLPSVMSNQPNAPFFGLSPTGLGRGSLEKDYQGHNFWDTEIWMLPVVTQLSTYWTRLLLNYRFRNLKAAMMNAKNTGFLGARFPWESAMTGVEVTNPCCPEIAEQEIHITADIAFAARHYFIVTNNTHWMQLEGCLLAQRIAEFWVSRVSLDEATGQYDIKYVMGPDEDHPNVTNNVFTNLAVHHALEFIDLTQSICETDPSFAAKCLDIAEKLKVPYDDKLDYNPQYEGYTPNTRIKQADAVLLSYPMLYPMKTSTLSNNLRIYENVTRPSGPAMTWSMHAIAHLDEGNKPKADELFEKGYKDYVREPFKVWSEVIRGKDGAANFITGVGGFLQAVINGYGGIRFHSNRMEVRVPHLLPGTGNVVISGIKYQGSLFTIKISKEPCIVVDYIRSYQTLHIVNEENKVRLMIEGIEYPIEGTIFVKATINYDQFETVTRTKKK